jgi:hypothetical protein
MHNYNTQWPYQALNFMTPSNLNKLFNLCLPLAYRVEKHNAQPFHHKGLSVILMYFGN